MEVKEEGPVKQVVKQREIGRKIYRFASMRPFERKTFNSLSLVSVGI